MAFYWTLTQDLPTEELMVVRPPAPATNGQAHHVTQSSQGESLAAFAAGIAAAVNNNSGQPTEGLRWRGGKGGKVTNGDISRSGSEDST